jgi:hypothetical protein
VIVTGPGVPLFDGYTGISGPMSFGSGALILANNASGDTVGIDGSVIRNVPPGLGVPHGYVSDSALSDSAIYDNATFSSLGVAPGRYEWTWGTGANQNFTLQIGPAGVPDAGSTFGLLFLSLVAFFGVTKLRFIRTS